MSPTTIVVKRLVAYTRVIPQLDKQDLTDTDHRQGRPANCTFTTCVSLGNYTVSRVRGESIPRSFSNEHLLRIGISTGVATDARINWLVELQRVESGVLAEIGDVL